MTYEFDWTDFTESSLKKLNARKEVPEDELVGFLPVKTDIGMFLVDIHYYKYDSSDKGFDLEIYKSNDMLMHTAWLDGLKDIKSATNYDRFCRRAENLIIEFLKGYYE